MKRFVRADDVDSQDLGAIGLRSEEQTGTHGTSIEHHGASAAHAMLAADMGSDQAEIVAQEINQRAARLHGSGIFRSVDRRGDRDFFRHYACPLIRLSAVAKARRTNTLVRW